jgi:hypothetical protein
VPAAQQAPSTQCAHKGQKGCEATVLHFADKAVTIYQDNTKQEMLGAPKQKSRCYWHWKHANALLKTTVFLAVLGTPLPHANQQGAPLPQHAARATRHTTAAKNATAKELLAPQATMLPNTIAMSNAQ